MDFRNYRGTVFFAIKDKDNFARGMNHMLAEVVAGGIFTGDNMISLSKNMGFLDDADFMQAVSRNVSSNVERSTIWRQAVVAWAAREGLRREGDFVECACYKGTTARIVCDYLDFGKLDKHYYLYDLFEHDPTMPHHAMSGHSQELYATTQARFTDLPNVTVTQGAVPAVLHSVAPEKIAFMHIDLNNADAEIGALDLLFDRMSPGAILVLDDFGWVYYHAQHKAETTWFAKRGYRVLELPTGQGLVIK